MEFQQAGADARGASGPRASVNVPPRPVLLSAAIFAALVAWWMMTHAFRPAVVRACAARYAAARTYADTLRVDTTIVTEGRALGEPRSCVSFRGNWQR